MLDIPVLHMHGFITSHNERQVFVRHIACHTFPKQLAACVQVLSGLLRVRYQIRRLFICANNPFVTGFSDIMHELMHILPLTTAKVSPLVLAAADRPE